MDLDAARAFLREHHHGVLATRRADGGIQQSPVLVNVDGDGRAIISSRETAYKVRNLRRDAADQLKKALRDGDLSEDEERRELEGLQKLTDRYTDAIDSRGERKEAAVMEV